MKATLSFFLVLLFYSSGTIKAQSIKDALSNNDTAKVLTLLSNGADINSFDPLTGTDFLMSASRYENNPAVVSFLLRNGAKVNKHKSPQGKTPLHYACNYYGCLNTIQLLVENGADVNSEAKDGTTPLMLAALNAKADVVQYLLSKGARKNTKDINGKTALDYALKSTDDEDTKRWIKCEINKAETIKALQ